MPHDSELDYDATALFTIPPQKKGVEETRGLTINGRRSLFTDLRDSFGVDVHVSRGLNSIHSDEDSVEGVVRPEYVDTEVRFQRFGTQVLSAYDVFRPTGRTLDTDSLVHSLNPMDMRRFIRRKGDVAAEILSPLGLFRKSRVIPKDDAAFQTLEDIDIAKKLVLKPNGGFASRDISAGSAGELLANVRSHTDEDYLLEERLDFSPPLPGLRGRDEFQQSRLTEANQRGVNKELRLYSFGTSEWHPVARVAEPEELRLRGDEWVYIDEDSVPADAIVFAGNVKRAIDDKFHDSDTLLAVDLVYVQSESRPEPHWEVMEVNAEPYIMRQENNAEVGRVHSHLLAAQLSRIAIKEKSVK